MIKPCPFCGEHLRRVEEGYKHPATLCVLTCFIVDDDELDLWNSREPSAIVEEEA